MREPLRLELVTPPAQLPVGLNEAKKQLGLTDDFTDDDALIAGEIEDATAEAERYLGRALITQTWRLYRDAWPQDLRSDAMPYWEGWREGPQTSLRASAGGLELPKPPLQSVTHVKTYDDSDAATTFASSNYFVDTASEPARIVLRTSANVPVIERVANGLEVQFVVGYGDNQGDVPEPIRQGILMTVAWLYTNRGDCEVASKNSGAIGRWRKYRVLRL